MNASPDGYVESADHRLDWIGMDHELHTWFNEEARATDAFVYGSRLHETIEGDRSAPPVGGDPDVLVRG